jgi:excisionase family DNA binding protein
LSVDFINRARPLLIGCVTRLAGHRSHIKTWRERLSKMTTERKDTPSAAGQVMTVREVAEWLRIHPTTLYRLLREDKIPGFRIGADWRFNRETVEEWLKQREAEES